MVAAWLPHFKSELFASVKVNRLVGPTSLVHLLYLEIGQWEQKYVVIAKHASSVLDPNNPMPGTRSQEIGTVTSNLPSYAN